jgi:hypothetical protein
LTHGEVITRVNCMPCHPIQAATLNAVKLFIWIWVVEP